MLIFIAIAFLIAFILFYKEIKDKKLLETVTKQNRGTRSERKLVLKLLKHGIPAQSIFHDLYLNKQNGSFSQIDLVVLAESGIIVFEVKDYRGWIFGNAHQLQWTQVLAYGKRKYRFYNPIKQNNKHILDLRIQLPQFDNVPFYSVIVFYGNCKLKDINFVLDRTFLVKENNVLDIVKSIMKSNQQTHYGNIDEVVGLLYDAVKNGGDKDVRTKHSNNIKNMLEKNSYSK